MNAAPARVRRTTAAAMKNQQKAIFGNTDPHAAVVTVGPACAGVTLNVNPEHAQTQQRSFSGGGAPALVRVHCSKPLARGIRWLRDGLLGAPRRPYSLSDGRRK